MATGSMRPCTYPGCSATQKGSRCDTHKGREKKQAEERRGTRHERGYTNKWAIYAKAYLARHPDCAIHGPNCTGDATEVDHITPHRGDMRLFWDTKNHQPTCKRCHSMKTATEDGRWGVERQGAPAREWVGAAMLPLDMGRPVMPLLVICGPPGAGKTSFVKSYARPGEMVLDLDVILAEVTRRPLYSPASVDEWTAAKKVRNQRLVALCSAPARWPRAWLIASAPKLTDRRYWRERGARVVMILPSLDECLRRIRGDGARPEKAGHEQACLWWWKVHTTSGEDEIVNPSLQFVP